MLIFLRVMADFQPMMYCGAVASGGVAIRDFVLGQYKTLNLSARQRTLMLNALACATEPTIIQE